MFQPIVSLRQEDGEFKLILARPYLKILTNQKGCGYGSVADNLLNLFQAPGSIFNTKKQ